MRPPPLPHPPGLKRLAKMARANGGAALEVLADWWEEHGGIGLEIASELRARAWGWLRRREAPTWAYRSVVNRVAVRSGAYPYVFEQSRYPDDAFFYRLDRDRDISGRPHGIRIIADPNVPRDMLVFSSGERGIRVRLDVDAACEAPGVNVRTKL